MEGARGTVKRLYHAFHDWRVRLYNDLQRLAAAYRRARRADMQQARDQGDQEVAQRGVERHTDAA